MRKETFIKAIEKSSGLLAKYLSRFGVEEAYAKDAVQDMVVALLVNKSYTRIESESVDRAIAFLHVAARNKLFANTKRDRARQEVVTQIEDANLEVEDPFDRTDFRDKEKDQNECPFCHKAVCRTKYKDLACPHCNTIVGRGKTYSEQVGVTDDELVSDMPDLDMQIDVNRAMEKLTPIERTIVEGFTLRNMSLDDMSLIFDIDRFSLRRIFLRAKDKLKKELEAYETV